MNDARQTRDLIERLYRALTALGSVADYLDGKGWDDELIEAENAATAARAWLVSGPSDA